MPRIKNGQKPTHKPVAAAKAQHRFEVDDLIFDIAELERTLPAKMVNFAKEYCKGDCTIKEAANRAGYSSKSLSQRGFQLVNTSTVTKLIDSYKRLDHLQNGLPISWKRYHLRKIVESEKSQDGAKINAIRLLSELDGNLRPGPAEGSQLVIHMNLGSSPGQTYEHDNDYEHDDALRGGRARNVPTGLLED